MVGQIYLNFIAFVVVCTKKRFYFCKNRARAGTFCAIKIFYWTSSSNYLHTLCPHLLSAFQQDLVVLKLFVFLVVSQCQCQCSQVCSLFCIFALISFPGPRLAISFLSKQPNLMFWWNIQIRAIYTKIMAIKIYMWKQKYLKVVSS